MLELPNRFLPAAQILLLPVDDRQAIREGARLVGQRLFEAADLLQPLCGLTLGVGCELVRFFARREQHFFLECFSVTLGLAGQSIGFALCSLDGLGRDPSPARDPPHDDPDAYSGCNCRVREVNAR